MSMLSWRRCLRGPSSPSDTSVGAGRSASAPRRPASALDRFAPSNGRAAAGGRYALRGLRHGAAALLLGLPLLLGFAAPAAAQQLTISAPADASEGNSGTQDHTFRVALSAAATDYVLFDVCFSGTAAIDMSGASTMAGGADYQPLVGGNPARSRRYSVYPRTMCVSSWIKTGDTQSNAIRIRVRGDREFEGDETVVATLELAGSPMGVTLGASTTVTHTIQNDDADKAFISMPQAFYKVIEGETVNVEVRLSKARSVDTAFQLRIEPRRNLGPRTATAGDDFMPHGTRSVTIPAGQTSMTVSVQAEADMADETDEQVTVAIWGPSVRSVAGVDARGLQLSIVTIIQPTVELKVFSNETRVVEGDEVPVVVKLSHRRSVDTEVVVEARHIDTQGQDFFHRTTLTVNIPAGQLFGYEDFGTHNDTDIEEDEKFELYISSGNAAADESKVMNVTLIDGDDTSNLLIVTSSTPTPFSTDDALALVEGGSGTFSVRLASRPLANVTVTISEESDPGNKIEFAGGAQQTTLTFTRDKNPDPMKETVWYEPQTVSVRARQDDDEEGHGRYLSITPSGGGYPPIPVRFRVSVNDDDDDDGQNTPTDSEDQVPDTPVANVEASVIDDASATVTWDEVEHATSYEVAWSGHDGGGQEALAGFRSVTGTSIDIDHNAQEELTLTVTVTPEYRDENGQVQRLTKLAGTVTLEVGPAGTQDSDDDAPLVDPYAALIAKMVEWRNDPKWKSYRSHTDRWDRALLAFGESVSDSTLTPMTAAEAQAFADRGMTRWVEVAKALHEIESGGTVTPDPVPEVTVSGGAGVTEGDPASFTVTANPAPAAPLTVALTVGQSGDVAAAGATGSREVTVPTGGSVTLDIATVDDAADEPDGSVSVTVDAGNGYTVGSANAHTVSVADDDAPAAITPELSLTAGSAVDEGGNAEFTINANPAPQAALTVQLTVAQSGDYLSAPTPASRTVTLAAGATSTTLTLATVEDGTDEADGSVSVTIDTGIGYTVAAGQDTGTVAVRDNDEPVVSIAAGAGVTEGDPASFTVTANPTPAAPLTVTLTVGQSGDVAAAGQTGSREVTVPTGGSVTVEVATDDDSADEPDGSVSATLAAGSGYTVAASPDDTATVEVTDNDEAAGVPSLSVVDGEGNENEGRLPVVIRLSPPSKSKVTVWAKTRESNPVSARAGVDYRAWNARWGIRIDFRPGETERRIAVRLLNDSHDEDAETFEVALSDPSGGAAIADGTGTMTIVNSDPMPAAWLARFGRTVAEQALDGIAGRMAASRTAGAQGTIAGQALSFGPGSGSGTGGGGPDGSGAANDNAALGGVGLTDGGSLAQSDVARAFGASGNGGLGDAGFGHDAFGPGSGPGQAFGTGGTQPRSQGMTGLEALLGSSFTATGEKDGAGGSMAFWGRAAQSSFDGREGTFSLDGETTTGMLGADYARGKWLIGMALMQSGGEGKYADSETGPQTCPADEKGQVPCDGAVREGDGKVEASLTAAIPYAAIQASERLKLWGALGYGTGEVTLKPDVGDPLKSDISWTMASAGLRGDLLPPPKEGSGPALAVTSDALWARTSSEKTGELAASDSDVTRLRLGLEGSWKVALEDGGHLTPKLEIGARHDGGDAETGFGVEVGGGIAWMDPRLGLSLDLSGRTLVAHGSDDLEDRGFAASLAFDPNPASARGPSLTLRQDWGGQANGGLDALFRTDPLADRTGSGSTPESRWQAEAAWGFPAFSGRFTGSPHVGLGLATGARDYSLGWRLTPAANANAPDVSFGLKATRRESDTAPAEHTFGFEAVARW